MKKILSTLLVASMLLSMVPAFAVSAAPGENDSANDGFDTIGSAAEYMDFVAAVNGGSFAAPADNTVNIVADLDFAGVTNYTPITLVPNGLTIDFGSAQGYAFKNLTYTATGNKNDDVELGLIANKVGNSSTITNLTLKNTTFNVTGDETAVAGVAGRLDRAAAETINTDGFTLNAPDVTGRVAGLIGYQHWEWDDHHIVISGKQNMTINAPNATVAILAADFGAYGDDGMHVSIKNVSGTVTILGAKNAVTDETLYGGGPGLINKEEFAENVDALYVEKSTINLTVINNTPAVKWAYIDSADEFVEFAKGVNDGSITPSGTVKVTTDIDLSGRTDYVPIERLTGFTYDLGGKTISGLNVTTATGTNKEDQGFGAGLIANELTSTGKVQNGTLKDSTLTVTGTTQINVGAVAGTSNRGYINNVNLNNVTITSEATGNVGGLLGHQAWQNNSKDVFSTTVMTGVTITAPNATVGAIAGYVNEGPIVIADTTSVDIKVPASANPIYEGNDTKGLFGSGTLAEGSSVAAGTSKIDITGNASAKWATIDSLDEYLEFIKLANEALAAGKTFHSGETIPVVVDLDFSNVENYVPFDFMDFTLDFKGNTVSGIKLDSTATNESGLIANKFGNNGGVKNIVLKDSILTSGASNVGAVAGYADRGYVDVATLENVSIISTKAGASVGLVIGNIGWGANNPNMTLTATNVFVSTAADATVGIVVGVMNGTTVDGPAKVNIKGVTVNGLTVVGATVADDQYIGANKITVSKGDEEDPEKQPDKYLTVAEDAVLNVVLNTTSTGYCVNGHVGGTATCSAKAVCELCGSEYGDTIPHTPDAEPTCTENSYCSECGHLLADKLGHIGGEATCSALAVCDRCEEAYGELDPDNHNEKEVAEVAATCSKKGTTAGVVCADCDEVISGCEEIAIDPDNHVNVVLEDKAPTADAGGYMDREICKDCGKIFFAGIYIDPCAHDGKVVDVAAKEATCTEAGNTEGWHCDDCGYVEDSVDVAAKGHNTVLEGAKDATCTEKGYTGDLECLECDFVKKGTEIAATGHTAAEDKVDAKDATCTEKGHTGKTVCAVCEAVMDEGEEVAAKGHDTELKNVKAATATEDGYTGDEVCKVCGETVKKGEVVKATGTTTPDDDQPTNPDDDQPTNPDDDQPTTPDDDEPTTPDDDEPTTPDDDQPTNPDDDVTPPQTGDATTYAMIIAAIALIGTAVVVSKKRHSAE